MIDVFDVQAGCAVSGYLRSNYQDDELERAATSSTLETVRIEGDRPVARQMALDVILIIPKSAGIPYYWGAASIRYGLSTVTKIDRGH